MSQLPTLAPVLVARSAGAQRVLIYFSIKDNTEDPSLRDDAKECFRALLQLPRSYAFAIKVSHLPEADTDEEREESCVVLLTLFLKVALEADLVATVQLDSEQTWNEGSVLTVIKLADRESTG